MISLKFTIINKKESLKIKLESNEWYFKYDITLNKKKLIRFTYIKI